MKKSKKSEIQLEVLRKSVKDFINDNDYKSIEEFCYDKEISKSTISVFLNKKISNDYRISTLERIMRSIDCELIIKPKRKKVQ